MTQLSNYSRRDFIKLAGAATAVWVAGRWWPVQGVGSPLPIPELITGTEVDGVMVYTLSLDATTKQLVTPGNATAIFGYNNDILGPTLQMRYGDEILINVTNNLGESTTTHWHGLHLPAEMDGGPHQTIEDGETWSPTFTMLNRASTCWYHPHPHGKTGVQVYKGLAGMLYVNDDESELLAIPKTYGIDDIPLIIQDRRFELDNSFALDGGGLRKGDRIMVNGAIEPILTTHAQMIRFRLLNGSNARLYNFGFHDDRNFYQIASGGGFLETPVTLNRLFLSPGERAEIVVDFKADNGSTVRLMSYSSELDIDYFGFGAIDSLDLDDFEVLEIVVGAATVSNPTPVTSLPSSLATITRIAASEAVNEDSPRLFELGEGALINGVAMDMNRIDQVVALDTIEIWEITNPSGIGHPFHVHDDSFQILSRDGEDPPPYEMGWKDTVFVKNGETVKIIRPFVDFADPEIPYMFHCHLLEHEDLGMMGQFTVEDAQTLYLPLIVNE